MSKKSGGLTADSVRRLADPIAQSLGLNIWDVRFVKEGASWYLRIFIDRESGVTIEDCENMSRAIDKPLDDLDPIDQSYILEVSSPGIERELTRPEHFSFMAGHIVTVNFFRPRETGEKSITAELAGLKDGYIFLKDIDETEFSVSKKDVSSVRLYESDEIDETDDETDIGGAE